MNKANLFLVLILNMSTISCSETYKHNNQKTLSTLLKVSHQDPSKTQQFYQQTVTRFNQHIKELYNELHPRPTDKKSSNKSSQTKSDTPNTAQKICLTIITEDLTPLKYKICNILKYITKHNLECPHCFEQIHADPVESPRIKIINSVINDLKNFNNILLDDTRIEHYQLLINWVADFSVTENHHEKNNQFLKALETIFINNEDYAKKLAILLNAETLNQEELEKLKT